MSKTADEVRLANSLTEKRLEATRLRDAARQADADAFKLAAELADLQAPHEGPARLHVWGDVGETTNGHQVDLAAVELSAGRVLVVLQLGEGRRAMLDLPPSKAFALQRRLTWALEGRLTPNPPPA